MLEVPTSTSIYADRANVLDRVKSRGAGAMLYAVLGSTDKLARGHARLSSPRIPEDRAGRRTTTS